MADAVLQEMERRFRIMLGIEGNIDAGSRQCQAKEFALARAVFDQKDGGVRNHIYRRTSAGNVPGSKMKSRVFEWCGITVI